MGVIVQNLHKKFHSQTQAAVHGVDFKVEDGALVALLGPSGSGKSTILRMIAGLERPDSGTIHLNGEPVTHLPPQKRGVGFVFQNYALFRHQRVRENIAFGLEVQKAPREEIRDRVEELLGLLSLKGLGDRYPHQLSGGQRQRVALARALAPKPKVLLLDEPFGAIDAKIRQELRDWLRELHDTLHVTSLLVTHDQEEALEICDKIIVMNLGQIEQEGTPEAIYNYPATEFVANFVGSMNILDGKIQGQQLQMGPYLFNQNGSLNFRAGDEIKVFFRPQDIYVSSSLNAYAQQAQVARTTFLGVNTRLEIETDEGLKFFAIIPQHIFEKEKLHEGTRISYHIEELSYMNRREGKHIKKLTIADYEI